MEIWLVVAAGAVCVGADTCVAIVRDCDKDG